MAGLATGQQFGVRRQMPAAHGRVGVDRGRVVASVTEAHDTFIEHACGWWPAVIVMRRAEGRCGRIQAESRGNPQCPVTQPKGRRVKTAEAEQTSSAGAPEQSTLLLQRSGNSARPFIAAHGGGRLNRRAGRRDCHRDAIVDKIERGAGCHVSFGPTVRAQTKRPRPPAHQAPAKKKEECCRLQLGSRSRPGPRAPYKLRAPRG